MILRAPFRLFIQHEVRLWQKKKEIIMKSLA